MIRIGVVGWGYWGAKLTRNLDHTGGAALAAIADPSESRVTLARANHPAVPCNRDSRSLLADPSIDAVAIAAPALSHFEIALAALRAGKHVLVEKPFVHNSESALRLIEEGDRRNLVVMVDHTFLFSPQVRTIARLFVEGSLGPLRSYESLRLNAGTVRDDLDVLWDVAPHDLAILDHLRPDPPVTIQVTDVTADSAGRALQASLSLVYSDGCVARIDVSWIAPRKTRQIRIACDGGGLDYDDLDLVAPLRRRHQTGPHATIPVLGGAEPLATMMTHFVECIASRKRPMSDGAMGYRVVRLLEAADQSRREGGALIELERAEAPR